MRPAAASRDSVATIGSAATEACRRVALARRRCCGGIRRAMGGGGASTCARLANGGRWRRRVRKHHRARNGDGRRDDIGADEPGRQQHERGDRDDDGNDRHPAPRGGALERQIAFQFQRHGRPDWIQPAEERDISRISARVAAPFCASGERIARRQLHAATCFKLLGHARREIGQHAVGAGALERGQRLDHRLVAVDPAVLRRRHHHRVFARHLIGEGRHAEASL